MPTFPRFRLSFLLRSLAIAAIGIVSCPLQVWAAGELAAAKRIEEKFHRPPLDAVRLNLWSIFGTVTRFAGDLDLPKDQLEAWLRENRWDLPHAPAIQYQNQNLPARDVLLVSSGQSREVPNFVRRDGSQDLPRGTRATITCDGDFIRISFVSSESDGRNLAARTPREDNLSARERWFWNGDLVALNQAVSGDRTEFEKWIKQRPRPENSVLLDDHVMVLITPVDIGRDRSWRFPGQFAPDPVKWFQETRPPASQRVQLEGCYYAIAVNSQGALLNLFFDPWDGGTICPAWLSEAQVTTDRTQEAWRTEIRIPWRSLKPNVNPNSVWGIDLARVRRSPDGSSGTVTRSPNPTFVRYDAGAAGPVFGSVPAFPETKLGALPAPIAENKFPAEEQWADVPAIREFAHTRSGRPADDIQARLTHDRRTLFVRFDCREADPGRLRVISRAEEIAEYGATNRIINYLDRREHFGLDWGDYVEVVLAPNLGFADRLHGGYFTFLVNSHGDLLERYFDAYGTFNVSPHPAWSSGAKARVTKTAGTWSVELAVPLGVLCTTGKVSPVWGLNLHRSKSAAITGSGEAHYCWSNTAPRDPPPGWPASLHDLRDPQRLGLMHVDPAAVTLSDHPNRPGLATARPAETARRAPPRRERQSDRLASVRFVDGQNGWAVGGLGTILHTTDGGANWREQNSGTAFILEKVFFLDRNRGWVVGGWPRDAAVTLHAGMGVILATTDGGKTWTPQLESGATWLKDVFFLDENLGWAAGEYGVVLTTTDGGRHWKQSPRTGTSSWLYGLVFLDRKRGFAVGHDETILSTTDGGDSWSTVAGPVPGRVNRWPSAYRSVAFAADRQRGWIVGDGGAVLHTRDGGRTWQNDTPDLPAEALELLSFENVSVAPDGDVWAVAPLAILRRKVTPEGRWRAIKTGQPGIYRSLSMADDRSGWISGERGTILRTTDGGETWVKQRDSGRTMGVLYGTAHDHHINGSAISAVSEKVDTAYICAGRGVRNFELGGDYNRNMVAAAAMALGVPVVHSLVEFQWRERDRPEGIAQRYQNYGGIQGVERQFAAMVRALRPIVLVAEQPVIQEGYYAHGVGEIARAVIASFDSAAAADKFPELLALGLEPYAPRKVYIFSNWHNEIYRIHPSTIRVVAGIGDHSDRLGMTYGEASAIARNCFWGPLDRGRAPAGFSRSGAMVWNLHLKKWRGRVEFPEKDILDRE